MNLQDLPKRKYGQLVKLVIVSLFLWMGVSCIQWWQGRGEGFRLYKIQDNLTSAPIWDLNISPIEEQRAKKILEQRFFYLGHGFQCYAFESEDRKYVVKFFRYQRLRLPQWVASIPNFPFFSEWRNRRNKELYKRREDLVKACKTSWQYAKKETALLYMQLNPNNKKTFPSVTLIDLLHNQYTIEIDQFQFMLQRKALHIKPTITDLLIRGDEAGAKRRIQQIFQFLLQCAKKGIIDTDGALIRKNNLGFLKNRAIYIDGGKLRYQPTPRSLESFTKDLNRLYALQSWIKKEHPVLEPYFSKIRSITLQRYASYLANGKKESSEKNL